MSIEIVNGDCIAGLTQSTAKVDLVVTSPPYNAGKEYETELAYDEYKKFAKDWIEAVVARLSDNASFWLNVGYMKVGENRAIPLTYLYYEICALPLVQEIVWHYEGGMSYSKRFSHRTERWMWFAKNPETAKFNLDAVRDYSLNRTQDDRNNPLGKNPTDYWYFDRVTNNSIHKTLHPCQFPERMIQRIVRACSDPGDLVLDPFMGSGTVGVVAKEFERSFLGYELDADYFAAAKKRLDRIIFTYE